MDAPIAKKIEKKLTSHNHTRIDNYYWLNNREDVEVKNYLESENLYTKNQLIETEDLQKQLFEEMKGRIKEDDSSVPYFKEGWWHYSRYESGKEYPFICRKKDSMESQEEIMLDVNRLAEKNSFYQLGGLSLANNKNLLAYSEDTISRRQYNIKVKDLTTGENLEDFIENTTGSITWANDNKTFFYVKKDEQTLRSYRIYKHKLGTSSKEDILVYEENDDTFNCGIYKTKSKKYLVIGSYSTLTSEYQILDANTPDGNFKLFQKRERGLEYSFAHFKDQFYIRTNLNAKNFRLMTCYENQTEKSNWTERIAHRKNVLLEDIELFESYLVIEERRHGLIQIRIIENSSQKEHYLDFGEEAYTAYIGTNPDFNSTTLRYGYTSLTTPSSVIDYDMSNKSKEIKKEHEVLGGFDKKNYQAKRVMVTGRDGEKIPMSFVYHKDTNLDGTAPCLQYGYGSYGINVDPTFSSTRLSLLDRGFIFAISHIRGSETLGRLWYENGKLLNKLNTFNDFIDCGKYLVEEKISSPNKLYAMGGSAGGMLMGGIINMEPTLWSGVISAVPFVDCVTTMLDDSIPLTTGEYDEWGNPNDKEYYEYMLKYSPVDNVEAKDYPNLLVTTGFHDSQVQYWEPAKWVAKLRELKTDSNLLLLHTNMETGHSGSSGRFEPLKETAMEYAFLIMLSNQ